VSRSGSRASAHEQAELRGGYAFQTFDMVIFATLIYFAFRNRLNPAAHKRLVLIVTISVLDAALGATAPSLQP
jgi:hypothetical protein